MLAFEVGDFYFGLQNVLLRHLVGSESRLSRLLDGFEKLERAIGDFLLPEYEVVIEISTPRQLDQTLTEIFNLRSRHIRFRLRLLSAYSSFAEHAGWLALQAGIAVCADAVLIPEIPYNLASIAAKLRAKRREGRTFGLVVVSEGANPAPGSEPPPQGRVPDSLKASLSPNATGESSSRVIHRSGQVAETVALQLQRLTDHETYPLNLGQLVKGGAPTAVDRQLGLGYGAAAVRALHENQSGVMVAFQPPDLKFVPLAEAINKVRTVPADSVFMQIARSVGITFGDEVKS